MLLGGRGTPIKTQKFTSLWEKLALALATRPGCHSVCLICERVGVLVSQSQLRSSHLAALAGIARVLPSFGLGTLELLCFPCSLT